MEALFFLGSLTFFVLGVAPWCLGIGADITSRYFLLTRVTGGDALFSGCVKSEHSTLSGF